MREYRIFSIFIQFFKRSLISHTGFKEGMREFSLDARVDPSRAKERREGKERERGERERERERERSKTGHDARDEHRW